ncbi:MAG TPA: circadian clock protein KaiC [Thermoanaerobaculia bacterium]|jgi:circadian clock protein KaiC|nr:circadian clock protein KaiC [Thermoanaerobaculia bacterium]
MNTLARDLELDPTTARGLPKAPTGIAGLDEVLGGGLPQGRPTLICGSAGCGKTLMAMEFLVRGAIDYGEPGVFLSFEEGAEELTQNVRSLGFDLDDLAARNLLGIDYVHVERSEIEETGEYDLDGLFIRLGYAIDSIGAKRVVLDTLEALFSSLTNTGILRAELRRLFRWLKDKGVTAVITGERGDGALTRYGLEEYISDCVILLDHRVNEQLAIRRLRVVKYRGSLHGTNEYPFIIDERGIEVLPITSLGLEHDVSTERVSTGIPALDDMLGGQGYFRGSSLLISGGAGTGKTSLACHFVAAACGRGERCIYFAFEESQAQIVRNMRSLGLDLESPVRQELLRFHAARPTLHGLERHLVLMHKAIRDFQPRIVVLDPVTNFLSVGTGEDVKAMLMRLLDFLKMQQITLLLTSLSHGAETEVTDVGISSLIDTWMLVRQIELSGERNRGLYVLKSRGMAHSNQVRELVLSGSGIDLTEVYLGPEGALTGSARLAQEARERREATVRHQEIERARLDLERRRQALEAKMVALRLDFETEEEEMRRFIEQAEAGEDRRVEDREEMARARQAKASPAAGRRRKQARGE